MGRMVPNCGAALVIGLHRCRVAQLVVRLALLRYM